MLQNIKQLHVAKLSATDGEIGHVKDFYFDDKTWAIRYLVIDTGSWLSGREVLLSPHAFKAHPFAGGEGDIKSLPVNLSRKQIEGSPSIDTHRPLSRQYEEEYYRYYGWPTYWQEGGMWGVAGFPVVTPGVLPGSPAHHGHNQRDDIHLLSTQAVTGYNINAMDGQIGAVRGCSVRRSIGYSTRAISPAPVRVIPQTGGPLWPRSHSQSKHRIS